MFSARGNPVCSEKGWWASQMGTLSMKGDKRWSEMLNKSFLGQGAAAFNDQRNRVSLYTAGCRPAKWCSKGQHRVPLSSTVLSRDTFGKSTHHWAANRHRALAWPYMALLGSTHKPSVTPSRDRESKPWWERLPWSPEEPAFTVWRNSATGLSRSSPEAS